MNNSEHSNCPKCHAAIPGDAPDGLCPKCALESAAAISTRAAGAGITPPPSIDELAPHFPDLEIIELLGAGGMGAVYKARQPQLDRFVALKILSHHLAGDPAFVERFDREAKVLGRLNHPNIVGIHDFGTAGPYCYLLMEYVDGVNLRQAMRAGRFTPTEALAMVQHLCSALKFAHEEGILHRDIKPENILIDSKGRVKVADFGIAKLVGEDRQHDVTLTMQGSVLGSPHYMAPEQIETPGNVDQRADIYSLGVVLYEMLTGGLPIGRFALPSEKAAMDARIDQIVMRTLEKEREARYQSAGEVLTSVDELKTPAAFPHPPHSVHGPAARFSLASAFLTGSSIVLSAVVPFLLFMPVMAPVGEGDGKTGIASIFAILLLIAASGSALTGFILGARAIGEIRRSGGVKTGLGSAIFAATAWPIILMFIFSGFIFNGLSGLSEILILLLTTSVAIWFLIQGIYRWAGGVTREDGTRIHPGLGRPILQSLLVAFGVPTVIVIGILLFQKISVNTQTASKYDGIEWTRGPSKLRFPVRIDAGVRATFRLVQPDGKGGQRITTIGQADITSNDPCIVEFGASNMNGSAGEKFQELSAMVVTSNKSMSFSSKPEISDWVFDELPEQLPVLIGQDRWEFQLASRRSPDGTQEEALVFEVETTPRDQ